MRLWLLAALSLVPAVFCHTINYEVAGAIPDDSSTQTAWKNGALLNSTLAFLEPGDTLLIPNKTFHLMGGIIASNLESVVIQIDGTLSFSDDMKEWPRRSDGKNAPVLECLQFNNMSNVTFSSSQRHGGMLDGNGATWWGIPGIGYLEREENRPRLLNIGHSRDLLIENLILKNSPYWTFWVYNVDGLEVRWTDISARRTSWDEHDVIDMTAFNTDGFDVTGRNVWIHDCNVWNQDDSIAVKDGSENMLFERINASGVGLTIGSIGGSVVRNITFRDCYMHNTFKGIYMKFRGGDSPGLIADVLYENIVMDEPEQWAIWIGPAQQSDSRDLCAAHPCSLCWPEIPLSKCTAPASGSYRNITLRNVVVNNPKKSPGVLLGSSANPMQNVIFDNVQVQGGKHKPWGTKYYDCQNVQGVATGKTSPVPPCFKDLTT